MLIVLQSSSFGLIQSILILMMRKLKRNRIFIMEKIITALYGRIPISLSANPLLEPYLIKMCKVGLKIVRKNITGSAFQKLSEENRKKGMDAIYMF